MIGLRTLARPALAALFVAGGLDALRSPGRKAEIAEPVAGPVASRLQRAGVRADSDGLVMFNAAVQVGAGGLLALGIAPRVAAVALAGSLVPTTLAGHRFWERQGADRAQQQAHFLKNVAVVGGLVFAALDTGGRPSVFWSGRRAADRAAHAVAARAGQLVEALPTR